MMSQRLLYLAYLLLCFIGALLAGGWLANSLLTLESKNTSQWQQQLAAANQEYAEDVRQWLREQTHTAELLATDPRVMTQLKAAPGADIATFTADPRATQAVYEFSTLKHNLPNVYVFDNNSQLLVKAKSARDLPLKVRETLSLAYQTGLDSYVFISQFDQQNWLLVTRRVREGSTSLGYVGYMLPAPEALKDLKNKSARWKMIDFILARRSGNDAINLTHWASNGDVLINRVGLSDLKMPFFTGSNQTFGVYPNLENTSGYMATTVILGFPFWQLGAYVDLATARAAIREARTFYLLGAGLFMLLLLTLMVALLRRVIDPRLPLLPSFKPQPRAEAWVKQFYRHQKDMLTQLRAAAIEAAEAPAAPEATAQQDEGPAFTPQGMMRQAARKMLYLYGKAQARNLSDAERERLQAMRAEAAQDAAAAKQRAEEANSSAASPTEEDASATKIVRGSAPEKLTPEEKEERRRIQAEKDEAAHLREVRTAIETERFRLYFQPIQELTSKENVMFETLLRLVDDEGKIMLPGEFIPLAIKHNFIDQIDDMVIVASLRRHMEILTQGKKVLLSINLSYGAFNSMKFMNTFTEGLEGGKMKPELLNFEVSSREIIEDDKAIAFIRQMQGHGCKFSVDFFGDPQKTVAAAKRLKFNYMKVNCLKFDGLAAGDPAQVEAFRDVVIAGQQQGLPLIAEKVETKSVLWLCEKLGVPYVQGFYIAEPSPKLNLGW